MFDTTPLKNELKKFENQLKTDKTNQEIINNCATLCLMIGTLDGEEAYLLKALEYGKQMTSPAFNIIAQDNKRKIKEERQKYYNNLKIFYGMLTPNPYMSQINTYLDNNLTRWSLI